GAAGSQPEEIQPGHQGQAGPRLAGNPAARLRRAAHRDQAAAAQGFLHRHELPEDRKSTRLNSSHLVISYAVFCLKKKIQTKKLITFTRLTYLSCSLSSYDLSIRLMRLTKRGSHSSHSLFNTPIIILGLVPPCLLI